MEIRPRSPLQIQRDVIFALMFRELKGRFGAYRLGIVWAIIQPIIFVSTLMAVRAVIMGGGGGSSGEVHGIPYVVFFMLGYMYFNLFSRIAESCASAIKSNRQLFGYRQVRPLDSLIARVIIEVIVWIMVMAVLLIGLTWFGFDILFYDPLTLFIVAFLLTFIGLGVGILLAFIKEVSVEIAKLTTLGMRALFFISGVFFSLEQVPKEYWPYLLWNPILHGTELARGAASPAFSTPATTEFLLSSCIFCLFIGLAIYRIDWRRLVAT